MHKPTRENLYNKIDSLSEEKRGFIYSPELLDTLVAISERHHLGDRRMRKLSGLVVYLLTDFLRPEDLVTEVLEGLQIDKRIAESVARDIKTRVLISIKKPIERPTPPAKPTTQLVHEGGERRPITPAPSSSAQEQEAIIKPGVQREKPTPPTTPFVIHEHKDQGAIAETSGYSGELARPSFYSQTDSGGQETTDASPPPTARLELGAKPKARIEPRTAKVGKERANIVHYSVPETPTNPFQQTRQPPEPKNKNGEGKPKPEIPPGNVVNLKDLPK